MKGWADDENPANRTWYQRRNELTIEDGCLLWVIRVIIPGSLRERVLQELHEGHPGIVRMKSLARLHVWWPKLDQSIRIKSSVPELRNAKARILAETFRS